MLSKPNVLFNIITCVDKNRNCVWKLPEHFTYFKKITINNIVIMSNEYFQCIDSCFLNDRIYIVIDKNNNYKGFENIIFLNSFKKALNFCKNKDKEIFVIGDSILSKKINNNYSYGIKYIYYTFIDEINEELLEDQYKYYPYNIENEKLRYGYGHEYDNEYDNGYDNWYDNWYDNGYILGDEEFPYFIHNLVYETLLLYSRINGVKYKHLKCAMNN